MRVSHENFHNTHTRKRPIVSLRTMRNYFDWIPNTYRYITTPSTTIKYFRLGPSSIKLQSTYFLLIALLNSSSRCSHYYSSHGFIFVTPTTTTPTTPSVVTTTTTTSTSTRLMSTSTTSTSTNTNIQKKYNAIVKNQKVPGLKHGMDYLQLGDSDLIVSKICCT